MGLVKKKKPLSFGKLKVKDYIHAMDSTDGHITALLRLFSTGKMGCKTNNLRTGKDTSVLEIAAACKKTSGKTRRCNCHPCLYREGRKRAGLEVKDYIHAMDSTDGHITALLRLFSTGKMGCKTNNLRIGKDTSVLEIAAACKKTSGKGKDIHLKSMLHKAFDLYDVFSHVFDDNYSPGQGGVADGDTTETEEETHPVELVGPTGLYQAFRDSAEA